MLRLRCINTITGASVFLGGEAPYFFLSQEGFDGTEASAVMAKSPYQHGKTRLYSNLDERTIRVSGAVVAKAEENGETICDLERLRRGLVAVLNPLDTLDMEIYSDEYRRMFSGMQIIDGPVFEDRDYTLPDGILYFDFTAVVPGNFLEDLERTTFHLMEVTPMLSFPLEFDETIMFGDMTMGGTEFINDGDVEAPIIVEIPGPVETPQITNLTTGEFIRVDIPIMADETMYISTAFGNKTVFIRDDNGNERNAFNYIDPASAFFSLRKGQNYLRFKAEVGNDTANVKVHFKKLYTGM